MTVRLVQAGIRSLTVSIVLITTACTTLPSDKAAQLTKTAAAEPLDGGRWGISIKQLDGTPMASLNSEARFVPASTLKLVTTISAMHYLGDFESGNWARGTAVYRVDRPHGAYPDLVLEGTGEASLSSAAQCEASCLSGLVDAVLDQGMTDIGTVLIHDSLFQGPYRPDGWGHEDLAFGYGTAISALSVDGATAHGRLLPGAVPEAAPVLIWETPPAFDLDVSGVTTAGDKTDLELDKQPASLEARLTGTVATGSEPVQLNFGLDDPALIAGNRFKAMLESQGVEVHGVVLRKSGWDVVSASKELNLIARLPRPDPRETLTEVLHESNNFHAETLLHHISRLLDDPTQEQGLELARQLLVETGAPEGSFSIADGSGVSFYNRMAPGTLTGLLVWAARQDWFDEWSPLLAHTGEDGTLEKRLADPELSGRIQAKTGTVFGADALAGYFTGDSGERYAFTIFINDSALSHTEARARIDALLTSFISVL